MVGRGVIGVLSVVVGVAGHGSLVYPRPRNSIDYLQGVNTQWYVQPVTVHVTCSNVLGCGIVLGWGWQSVLELGALRRACQRWFM
jgi:hypothetical protein